MKRIRNATDAGLNLDKFPDRRVMQEWVLIEGVGGWSRADEDRYQNGIGRCAACGRHSTDPSVSPANRYCIQCDSAGLDGRVNYPGEVIGSRIDPDWPAEPTKVGVNRNGLRGGKGERKVG